MSIVKNDKSHMPIYHGNKSIKMINHGENLVYKERIPEGTNLWNEDRVFVDPKSYASVLQKYSSYPLSPTGTLTNNFKFSDIRNGITITTSKLNAPYGNIEGEYSDEFVFSKSYTSKISREDILSGNSILVWTGQAFSGEKYNNTNTGHRNIADNVNQRYGTLYDIYFQLIDDTNFKITCTDKSHAVWTNSTEFYGYAGGYALLKIESIIAY